MSTKRESDLNIKDKKKFKKPSKYNVIFNNDDYTPMVFVELILQQIFHKNSEDAKAITLSVHKTGKGIAGTYSREIADTKSNLSNETARTNGFPLLVTIEKE